jgi:hypothetical protein
MFSGFGKLRNNQRQLDTAFCRDARLARKLQEELPWVCAAPAWRCTLGGKRATSARQAGTPAGAQELEAASRGQW